MQRYDQGNMIENVTITLAGGQTKNVSCEQRHNMIFIIVFT